MGKIGKPRGRATRPKCAHLFFRPSPDEAPGYWPKESDGTLRWAHVLKGGCGWALVGEPDVLRGREIRDAREIFGLDFEDAEFREERV